MTTTISSDHDGPDHLTISDGEQLESARSGPAGAAVGRLKTKLLGTIAMPGLADIELDGVLPRDPPRVPAFD